MQELVVCPVGLDVVGPSAGRDVGGEEVVELIVGL